MNATAPLPGSGLTAPTLPSPPTSIPWLGLIAVLMGTFISTLNGRLSTFGLADIRGAVGAGFDEGAWITTAQTAAQMLVTIPAVWMGATYGPRRVLIGASIAFAVISLLTPLLAEPAHAIDDAVPGRSGHGILHPAHLELHIAQHAAQVLGVRHRHLCTQSRAVAQHFGFPRRLVCRASFVAMDLLAERAARADHVALPASWHRRQADHHTAAERCIWPLGGRLGARADLCGPRSGQSARLVELRIGVGVAVGRCLAARWRF